MQFSFSVKKLYENLNNALLNIQEIEKLVKNDKLKEKELMASLQNIANSIQKEIPILNDLIEQHKSKIEVLEFLTTALNMEYKNIFDYKKYIPFIVDNGVKELLRNLSEEEAKHYTAFSKIIKQMGGEAILESFTAQAEEEISLKELLTLHLESEKQSIDFYEKGLSSFNYPEIQWLLGNIKTEEETHLRKIQEVLDNIGNKNLIIKREKNTWFDPYMGEPGDRPWID